MAWWFGPAGVGEHGIGTVRGPQELGTPCALHGGIPDGGTGDQPLACQLCVLDRQERNADVAVRSREAQGSVPEGEQGIGTPHSTREAGEHTRVESVEGRRCLVTESLSGNMASAS